MADYGSHHKDGCGYHDMDNPKCELHIHNGQYPRNCDKCSDMLIVRGLHKHDPVAHKHCIGCRRVWEYLGK